MRYNFTEIRQAVVFAPSAVTGYVASRRGREVLECDCDRELGTEARIIRVYESDEILSNLRIWHKVFLPSHLQIQEVRFAFYHGGNPVRAHSMQDLVRGLERKSKEAFPPGMAAQPWYASASAACTRKLEAAQSAACRAVAGTTLGPALTFAVRAAMHAAGKPVRQPGRLS